MEGFEPEELVQQEVEMAGLVLVMAVEELFQEVPGQEEAGMEVLMPVGEVEEVVVLPMEVASMLNQELQTLASLHYQSKIRHHCQRLDSGIWRILRTLNLNYSEAAQ